MKYIYFFTLLTQFILKSTCNEVVFGELLLLVAKYIFVYFLTSKFCVTDFQITALPSL